MKRKAATARVFTGDKERELKLNLKFHNLDAKYHLHRTLRAHDENLCSLESVSYKTFIYVLLFIFLQNFVECCPIVCKCLFFLLPTVYFNFKTHSEFYLNFSYTITV